MHNLLNPSRRHFVQTGMTVLACVAANPAFAIMPRNATIKHIAFRNLHTDEKLRIAFWRDGAHCPDAMTKISNLMRDNYSGETHPIDTRLVDFVHDLQQKLHHKGMIEIVSGYRSPYDFTEQSLHAQGMAVDLRMPGVSLIEIYKTAYAMRRGGVGFYPDAQFVHIDVGPILS